MAKCTSQGYEIDTIALPVGKCYMIRHNTAPPNGRISLHYHDHYELLVSLSGNLVYTVAGQQYSLESDTLLIIAPYQLHQPRTWNDGYTERICLRFAPSLLTLFSDQEIALDSAFSITDSEAARLLKLNSRESRTIFSLMQALLYEQKHEIYGKNMAERTLLTLLFLSVQRAVMQGVKTMPASDPVSLLVHQIASYIENNHTKQITLELLEKEFHISRSWLSRCFLQSVGCPPYKYLLQKRLQHAERLLREGVPPQQAALVSGFRDYTNFYRQFCSFYGMSPRMWKERMLEIEEADDTNK